MSEQGNPNTNGAIPAWTLSDRLRKARETVGLSQSELAEETGISESSVGNYENGRTNPRRPQLLAWAMRTGVPLEWLMHGTEPEDGPDAPSGLGIKRSGCIAYLDATERVVLPKAA